MTIKLTLVPVEEKPTLRLLLNRYLAELATFGEVDQSYPYFDSYWQSGEARWPYFLRSGGYIIGFALLNTIPPSGRPTDFAMAEFYIVPEARGQQHGLDATNAIFAAHRGQWEIGIMAGNIIGRNFWPRAIHTANAQAIQQTEQAGEVIYRFTIA